MEQGVELHIGAGPGGPDRELDRELPAVAVPALQLEALAQAGAIAVLSDERYAETLPLFGGVDEARFRRIVRPGDEMTLTVEIERLSRRGGWGRGVATVDGQECCRARLLFVVA